MDLPDDLRAATTPVPLAPTWTELARFERDAPLSGFIERLTAIQDEYPDAFLSMDRDGSPIVVHYVETLCFADRCSEPAIFSVRWNRNISMTEQDVPCCIDHVGHGLLASGGTAGQRENRSLTVDWHYPPTPGPKLSLSRTGTNDGLDWQDSPGV